MLRLADLRCACGSDQICAISPGQGPVYGMARDMFGVEDKRLPRILIEAPVPTVATCMACMPRRPVAVAARP